jgi:hypothetical protein
MILKVHSDSFPEQLQHVGLVAEKLSVYRQVGAEFKINFRFRNVKSQQFFVVY